MKPYLLFIFLLGSSVSLSCSSSSEQREFEREAFRDPIGITRTNDQGGVENEDPDDWRIAPLFQALIDIRPPFPNPATISDRITFEIAVTGVRAIDGVIVFELDRNGNLLELFSTADTPSTTSFIVFEINPLMLQNFGGGNEQRGLHRILIYDFNNQLISYGDLEIE